MLKRFAEDPDIETSDTQKLLQSVLKEQVIQILPKEAKAFVRNRQLLLPALWWSSGFQTTKGNVHLGTANCHTTPNSTRSHNMTKAEEETRQKRRQDFHQKKKPNSKHPLTQLNSSLIRTTSKVETMNRGGEDTAGARRVTDTQMTQSKRRLEGNLPAVQRQWAHCH